MYIPPCLISNEIETETEHVLVCFLAIWVQYLVDVFFVSLSSKPLCHGVDDGDDKVDYHGQKDVAKHPGEFAGFLIKRGGKGGHMIQCLIPRSGLGTSLTKMSSHFRVCVCVCEGEGEEIQRTRTTPSPGRLWRRSF